MASHSDTTAPRLRWGRAAIAAVVAEVMLMCVAVPVYASMAQADATALLGMIVPPASFVIFVAAGYWSAKPVRAGGAMLQGALAGVVAVVAYIALGFVASLFVAGTSVTDGFTPAYLAAHVLKIVGGAIGGWLVSRKAAPAA
jgi:hypothetical protein